VGGVLGRHVNDTADEALLEVFRLASSGHMHTQASEKRAESRAAVVKERLKSTVNKTDVAQLASS
jgi:hypothetical protein